MTNKSSSTSVQVTRLNKTGLDRDEEVYEAELVENHDKIEPAPATFLAHKLGRIAGGVGSILISLLGLSAKGGDMLNTVGGHKRGRGRRRRARGRRQSLRRRQV